MTLVPFGETYVSSPHLAHALSQLPLTHVLVLLTPKLPAKSLQREHSPAAFCADHAPTTVLYSLRVILDSPSLQHYTHASSSVPLNHSVTFSTHKFTPTPTLPLPLLSQTAVHPHRTRSPLEEGLRRPDLPQAGHQAFFHDQER